MKVSARLSHPNRLSSARSCARKPAGCSAESRSTRRSREARSHRIPLPASRGIAFGNFVRNGSPKAGSPPLSSHHSTVPQLLHAPGHCPLVAQTHVPCRDERHQECVAQSVGYCLLQLGAPSTGCGAAAGIDRRSSSSAEGCSRRGRIASPCKKIQTSRSLRSSTCDRHIDPVSARSMCSSWRSRDTRYSASSIGFVFAPATAPAAGRHRPRASARACSHRRIPARGRPRCDARRPPASGRSVRHPAAVHRQASRTPQPGSG